MTTGPTTTTPDTFEQAPDGRPSEQPYLYLALECDQPRARGARYALANVDEVVIGRGTRRSASKDSFGGVLRLRLELPGRYLSSLHARIRKQGADWYLEDAGSTNGSFVNGERVPRKQLRALDVIEIGHKILMLSPAEPTPAGVFSDQDAYGSASHRGIATLIPGLAGQFTALKKIAKTTLSVLILGETGTGKELVSLALHEISGRSGPFVAVNCGALTANLAESQLFGHTRGAFSGAIRDEPGFLRSAHHGSLLLDEIGDLPEASQPILLRVLQDMRVVPVGSARAHQVDVRFIAATHKDVSHLVTTGGFRRDLLARLNGFTLRLPPLRERKPDLGLVIGDLLSTHFGQDDVRIAPDAAYPLFAYDWPANVRELEQCLLRACALSNDRVIRRADLSPDIFERPFTAGRPSQAPRARHHSEEEIELRRLLIERLTEHGGNVSEVARSFGKARIQIQRWMRRFNVHAAPFRK